LVNQFPESAAGEWIDARRGLVEENDRWPVQDRAAQCQALFPAAGQRACKVVFAAGKPSVELADVIAVVSDASALELDEIIDAAFAGRTKELEAQLGKARTAALSPDAILWAALRHVGQLHKARLAVDKGASADAAAGSVAPFLSFTRKAAIEAALALWSSPRLARTMTQLADAQLTTRRQSNLAQLVAHRALIAIAASARRKQDVTTE